MAYIGKGLDNGVRNQFIFAATQGQTAFSGADSDGKTLAISDILYTDCYQNGVKLEPTTDYTVTLTSLTLVNAASLNDVINIVSFDIFAVPDTVPASTGGTFGGGITATTGTFSGTLGVTGVLSAGNNIIAGNDLTANYNFTQGAVSSASSASFNSTSNWNYPQLQIKRDASNTASFKAMSFLLNGDTTSDTNLYNYPNIIITTDTAPTTSDTSVAENASLTINTPSQIRFGTNGSERMRITEDGRGLSQFTAKAWVNFNGAGTVAIRDSHNVSSITDNGTGDYTVNFSNNMANANYSTTYAGGQKTVTWGVYLGYSSYGSAVGSHRFFNVTPGDTVTDTSFCSLTFFGD